MEKESETEPATQLATNKTGGKPLALPGGAAERVKAGKVQLWEGGPYWAEMNIGATKPEECGHYFWWGDTVGYKRENHAWVASDGSSVSFSFSEENAPTFGKSVDELKSDGWITEDGVLAPEHDAAHVQWGGAWHMPTKRELWDLNSKCDWTWTTVNGVSGYVVKGKDAYASASIFLPCAGYGRGTSLNDAGSRGNDWSSVPYSGSNYCAWRLNFTSGRHSTDDGNRSYGRSVRPVQSDAHAAPEPAKAQPKTEEKATESSVKPLGGGKNAALYCIVDLTDGPNADKYPVAYLEKPPAGGFNTDEYKTTKLVLRRIDPGSFFMGKGRKTTLTKPFYCGLFEVTQKQYALVTGDAPSQFKGDMRPVENVTYNGIRGNGEGAKWPASSAVDEDSFMGRLRARTGIAFDLPTGAQWEYACRAGTRGDYNNGTSSENGMRKLGRFTLNQKLRGIQEPDADFARHKPDGKGGCTEAHTVVGSYAPNAWGLYDMHGNVWELCLDWHGELEYGADPAGPSWGSLREMRGGSWYMDAHGCRSSKRLGYDPGSRTFDIGFRVVQTLLE